ncbi:MAG: Hsp20/alpha crystallin family protein [Coriobacteriaceae bacterium]|nr:Hsp20/alpha crystallin family protein [Coriobacteriaceae bacterium]
MPTLAPRNTRRFLDPFDFSLFPMESTKSTSSLMKTNIKESDSKFELDIELPGFKKEDIKAEIADGYLTVSAETSSSNEDSDEKGTYLRKERFEGKCSRSFYVGDEIEEDAIEAKFEDGILKLDIPKIEQPQPEEKKSISIS